MSHDLEKEERCQKQEAKRKEKSKKKNLLLWNQPRPSDLFFLLRLAPELGSYVIPKRKEVVQESVRLDEILDTGRGFAIQPPAQERLLSLQRGAVRPWTAHGGHSDLPAFTSQQ